MADNSNDLPISPPEEVGKRLDLARRRLGLSQTDFAIKAQIGRERLASYESGRVTLPWEVGVQICKAHNLNVGWIAEGRGPWQPFWTPLDKSASARGSLVDVYRSLDHRSVAEAALSVAAMANFGLTFKKVVSNGSSPWKQSSALADALEALHTLFDVLPPDDRKKFAADFAELAEAYVARLIDHVAKEKKSSSERKN